MTSSPSPNGTTSTWCRKVSAREPSPRPRTTSCTTSPDSRPISCRFTATSRRTCTTTGPGRWACRPFVSTPTSWPLWPASICTRRRTAIWRRSFTICRLITHIKISVTRM
uniref:(northern house mosquito) hypothetical protein n=1 Tax=Culex pipiens TaxID=7175 RepID=A0A8D8NLP6_CULPI